MEKNQYVGTADTENCDPDYSEVFEKLSYDEDVSMETRKEAANEALKSMLESRRTRGINIEEELNDPCRYPTGGVGD